VSFVQAERCSLERRHVTRSVGTMPENFLLGLVKKRLNADAKSREGLIRGKSHNEMPRRGCVMGPDIFTERRITPRQPRDIEICGENRETHESAIVLTFGYSQLLGL
jgi:hypothetical protein